MCSSQYWQYNCSCIISTTHIHRHTEFKQLTICSQFPKDYPNGILLLEIRSKTVSDKLIEGLVRVCEQELEKHRGEKQLMTLVKFINNFIVSNPFLVCSNELSFIKKDLTREGDEIKIKQKSGTIHYKAFDGRLKDLFLQ